MAGTELNKQKNTENCQPVMAVTRKNPNLNRKNNGFYNDFRLFFHRFSQFFNFFLLKKIVKFVQFFKTVNQNKNWNPNQNSQTQ